jgi:hypothetical protein
MQIADGCMMAHRRLCIRAYARIGSHFSDQDKGIFMEDTEIAHLHGQLLALKVVLGALIKTHPREAEVREMLEQMLPGVQSDIEAIAIPEFGIGFNLAFTNVME